MGEVIATALEDGTPVAYTTQPTTCLIEVGSKQGPLLRLLEPFAATDIGVTFDTAFRNVRGVWAPVSASIARNLCPLAMTAGCVDAKQIIVTDTDGRWAWEGGTKKPGFKILTGKDWRPNETEDS